MAHDHADLLAELDAFLNRHGLADSTFGLRATGDSHLLARIRAGRPLRRSTILRVRRFMARTDLLADLEDVAP
jgi:hypothetical protein